MASPTQNHSPAYDVFLNHRGPDTKGFAGHLYHRIRSQGIRVFLDKYELPVGSELTDQITTAIKTASVHVAVFSENYAKSSWCLNELVLMMESLESGASIIPVFHGVKPSILRRTHREDRQNQENVYAEDLQILEAKTVGEARLRYAAKWRGALSSVADISGFELDTFNGFEAELVENVFERVSEKVIKTPYNVPKYENIGLDVKVKGVEDKVSSQQQQNGKPRVVGIDGLGGVGKTTLAKEFFHEKSPAYRNSCFFPVRRIARTTPLDYLFGELFKRLSRLDMLFNNIGVVKNLYEYSSPLDRVRDNPSLVILDGVDNAVQGNALLSIQDVLTSNSLILITSRDRDVLRDSGVVDTLIYKLSGLDKHRPRKLFCLHAFHQAAPFQGYEYLVVGFLSVCDGLPLLLEVFGAFLYGKNERSYWEKLLDRFQEIYPCEIDKQLKLIYDRLDIKEQHVFLDIARFFIGESTETALARRKGSGWKGSLWLQTLVEKRLVEVDRNYDIKMHHHLEDLGKSIAKKTREPRPLWPKTDNYADLLQESHGITELRRNIDALSRQSSVQSSVTAPSSILHRLSNKNLCTILLFFKTLTGQRIAWIYADDPYNRNDDDGDEDLEYAAKTLNNLKLKMQSPNLSCPNLTWLFWLRHAYHMKSKAEECKFCNSAHYRVHIWLLNLHSIRKSFPTHHCNVWSLRHFVVMRCGSF